MQKRRVRVRSSCAGSRAPVPSGHFRACALITCLIIVRSDHCSHDVFERGLSRVRLCVAVVVMWVSDAPSLAPHSLPQPLLQSPLPHTPSTPLQDGNTPLHCAAVKDQVESIRLLLDRGANTEAKDKVLGEGRRGICGVVRSVGCEERAHTLATCLSIIRAMYTSYVL